VASTTSTSVTAPSSVNGVAHGDISLEIAPVRRARKFRRLKAHQFPSLIGGQRRRGAKARSQTQGKRHCRQMFRHHTPPGVHKAAPGGGLSKSARTGGTGSPALACPDAWKDDVKLLPFT